MNYLTPKRQAVRHWLEANKAITIKQCEYLFFQDVKAPFDNARTFLKDMEKANLITGYYIKDTKQKIYKDAYEVQELKYHEILRLDFIAKLQSLADEKILWKTTKLYNDKIRPDALIFYKYKGDIGIIILEVDYNHITDNNKLQLYKEWLATGEAFQRWNIIPKIVLLKKGQAVGAGERSEPIIHLSLSPSTTELEHYLLAN